MDKVIIEIEQQQNEESNDKPESEIGSDADFQAHAERAELKARDRKEFDRLDKLEGTSIRRSSLMHEGFHAGFEAAASDYVNGKVNVEVFEKLRTERDLTDFYALGFELGYFRKLAEIATL
jgi:hypothetical protein